MSDQQASYRKIMKGTSIFGGVQVFNILISVIRSKFIAILLGPSGMGIAGLLISSSGFIGVVTSFGLGTSAIKDVALANETGDHIKISKIIIILRRFVWITGFLGVIIMLVLSPWLSKLVFGNNEYTIAFIWLSITLLFNQLSTGQLVVLQGLHKLQNLAKANLSGSVIGLIVSIPLYYKYGNQAIVPAIIIASIISLFFSWYFSKNIKVEKLKVSKVRTIAEGKEMILMGWYINLCTVFAIGASYLLKIFLNKTGGFNEVGLYNAGFAIINTYVGLIFSAMGTDYYPRLSAIAKNNQQCKETINQQAEITLLILSPIILIFLVFVKWIILILYSGKFVEVNEMIHWAALGMFFKAASWSIAFVFLAKGDKKILFFNELTFNSVALILNIIGYKLMGLTGLGITFLISYFFYLIQVYVICRKKYTFSFTNNFSKLFAFQFSLAICCMLVIQFLYQPWNYFLGIIIITISLVYSYKELDKRLNIKSIFLNVFKQFRN